MMMHENSLLAFAEERELGHLTARQNAICEALQELKAATDRQVMRKLGYDDPNAIRPRITELVKMGVLLEVGSCRDSVTGKQVRIVAMRGTHEN